VRVPQLDQIDVSLTLYCNGSFGPDKVHARESNSEAECML